MLHILADKHTPASCQTHVEGSTCRQHLCFQHLHQAMRCVTATKKIWSSRIMHSAGTAQDVRRFKLNWRALKCGTRILEAF